MTVVIAWRLCPFRLAAGDKDPYVPVFTWRSS